MGYYIETDSSKNKAKWLIDNAKAKWVTPNTAFDKDNIPVVVIDNGPFEAAGIAFDKRELEAFLDVADRHVMLLSVPREEVLRLQPLVADILAW